MVFDNKGSSPLYFSPKRDRALECDKEKSKSQTHRLHATDFPRITESMCNDTFRNPELKDTLFSSRSDYRLHGTSTVYFSSFPSEEEDGGGWRIFFSGGRKLVLWMSPRFLIHPCEGKKEEKEKRGEEGGGGAEREREESRKGGTSQSGRP